MDEAAAFGVRVRAARERLGITLTEAARRSKIVPQKFQDAENGADSRATTVAAIARGLNVSADSLLGLRPFEDPHDATAMQPSSADYVESDRERAITPETLAARLTALEGQGRDYVAVVKRVRKLGDALRILLDAELLPQTLRDQIRGELGP